MAGVLLVEGIEEILCAQARNLGILGREGVTSILLRDKFFTA
jgi:hypothetical protein